MAFSHAIPNFFSRCPPLPSFLEPFCPPAGQASLRSAEFGRAAVRRISSPVTNLTASRNRGTVAMPSYCHFPDLVSPAPLVTDAEVWYNVEEPCIRPVARLSHTWGAAHVPPAAAHAALSQIHE